MQADSVGGITPAVLATLRPGEKILAAHGLMLYKDGDVKVHRRTMKSLGVSWSHLMGLRATGDTEEGYFFAEFEGPGHVTFSRDKGGEVRIVQLAPGQVLRLREGHLICLDETVQYYPMVLAQYPSPTVDSNGQRKTVYVFADQLTGPGTIVFQSFGNILSFDLKPGEAMRTSIDGLLAVAPTVSFRINWLGGTGMVGTQGAQIPIVDLSGPGSVLVHSGL